MNVAPDAVAVGLALHSLVGPDVSVACLPISAAHVGRLTTAEAAIVAAAVFKRRAEFATGRAALRQVIGADVEVLRRGNGAPDLPLGRVASLAHDHELAVAVSASERIHRSIGVDIEPERTLSAGEAIIIVRPDDQVDDALTAFVAKEAVYKAWSSSGGDLLDHHDVRVSVVDGRIRATIRGATTIDGRVTRSAGRLLAFAFIPAT